MPNHQPTHCGRAGSGCCGRAKRWFCDHIGYSTTVAVATARGAPGKKLRVQRDRGPPARALLLAAPRADAPDGHPGLRRQVQQLAVGQRRHRLNDGLRRRRLLHL